MMGLENKPIWKQQRKVWKTKLSHCGKQNYHTVENKIKNLILATKL